MPLLFGKGKANKVGLCCKKERRSIQIGAFSISQFTESNIAMLKENKQET